MSSKYFNVTSKSNLSIEIRASGVEPSLKHIRVLYFIFRGIDIGSNKVKRFIFRAPRSVLFDQYFLSPKSIFLEIFKFQLFPFIQRCCYCWG